MELIGFDSTMMAQIYKMFSAALCSTSAGQVGVVPLMGKGGMGGGGVPALSLYPHPPADCD